MSDLHQYLKNGRGRIRCYWCKYEMPDETGPWAVTREHAIEGYLPVCYGHSSIPIRAAITDLRARVGDRR